MKRIILLMVLSLSLFVLAACGAAPEAAAPKVNVPVAEAAAPEEAGAALGETLVDEQGAVSVAVTPRTVDADGTTLDFEVALNTHSVDLSMDLSQLATLTTDTGAQVTASGWNAPQGGHHVSGVLSFPAASDGNSLLAGATTLTLTLANVDAPERTFTWSLK